MNTAKIFKSGNSQAVRLPKEFRFSGDEVYIKRVGRGVILIPKDEPWELFEQSLGEFTGDYMEGKRVQPLLEDREEW
ncbi:MAG: type II toxin-antitoxin system VapB family antitoxin [Syntrophobacteraceae bacterium]|jgi:antitoxin VapB